MKTKELEQIFELLRQIEEKRGPYSQHQLTHAENVINQSSENAKKIRLILEGLLKEEKETKCEFTLEELQALRDNYDRGLCEDDWDKELLKKLDYCIWQIETATEKDEQEKEAK